MWSAKWAFDVKEADHRASKNTYTKARRRRGKNWTNSFGFRIEKIVFGLCGEIHHILSLRNRRHHRLKISLRMARRPESFNLEDDLTGNTSPLLAGKAKPVPYVSRTSVLEPIVIN